jgi:hypothetical protein
MIGRRKAFPILSGRQIVQGISRALFIEEKAVFRIFCKRDFCVEVRDFKISEPEAESSHRRRRLGLDGLPGKMLR